MNKGELWYFKIKEKNIFENIKDNSFFLFSKRPLDNDKGVHVKYENLKFKSLMNKGGKKRATNPNFITFK